MLTLKDMLKEIFQQRCHILEVFCFDEPQELLETVKAQPGLFDVYFLDVRMPSMRGTRLSRELRQLEPGCKFVFITAFDDAEVLNAFHYSADAFVPKRLLAERLPDEVAHLLDCIHQNQSAAHHYFEAQMSRVGYPDSISLLLRLRLVEILYFECSHRKVRLHATDVVYALQRTDFKTVLETFSCRFIQTHRCFLVNPMHIRAVNTLDVVLNSGERLPLSRHRHDNVKVQFMDFMDGRIC